MTKLVAAVVLGILVVAPRAARAQLQPLEPGARVRGGTGIAGLRRFDATVIRHDADTLVIARNGVVTPLALARVRRLEVYRGHDRRAGARDGAIGGAIGGFLVGGYAGLVASAHSRTCPDPTQPTTQACERRPWSRRELWEFTGGFTALGLVTGLGSGALLGKDRWERVTPSRTSIVPVPGGIGIRIATGR